jgi:hypothetical protein
VGDGDSAYNAFINAPFGLWLDEVNHVLYITEMLGCRVRGVDMVSGIISTVAGTGRCVASSTTARSVGTAAATSVVIAQPSGIWGNTAGQLFIADQASNIGSPPHFVVHCFVMPLSLPLGFLWCIVSDAYLLRAVRTVLQSLALFPFGYLI